MSTSYTNDARKSKAQLLTEVFMTKMRSDAQRIPTFPTMPDLATRKLRARLMLEEVLETIEEGLGLSVVLQVEKMSLSVPYKVENIVFEDAGPGDLVQVADGCCDVEVVTLGTASACGIALEPCYEIVAANNLRKFAPGHYFREDGKLVKPPDHPNCREDLLRELMLQGAPGIVYGHRAKEG
jgi:predicted HAD superfamily Cof-like phosphohydrolase